MPPMTAVTTMSAMPVKQVHQWTKRQQQVRQDPKEVGAML